jgi:hypothetical protein
MHAGQLTHITHSPTISIIILGQEFKLRPSSLRLSFIRLKFVCIGILGRNILLSGQFSNGLSLIRSLGTRDYLFSCKVLGLMPVTVAERYKV